MAHSRHDSFIQTADRKLITRALPVRLFDAGPVRHSPVSGNLLTQPRGRKGG